MNKCTYFGDTAKFIFEIVLEISDTFTILAAMSDKKSEALQHTTCKLHPIIFTEIDKRVDKKEFASFNAGLNKLLLKALNIKLSKIK